MEVFLGLFAALGVTLSLFFTLLYQIILALFICLCMFSYAVLQVGALPFRAVANLTCRVYWYARRKVFLG
jgi:hypothetical protein